MFAYSLIPDGNNWNFLHSKDQAVGADGKTPVGIIPADEDAARVLGWMESEVAPYVHGYYEFDWADGIVGVRGKGQNQSQEAGSNVLYWSDGVSQASKPNARYIGFNLLSELDAPGEYYVSREDGLIYYLPAVPIESWDDEIGIPVFSVDESAVSFGPGTTSVAISGVTVAHATSVGITGAHTAS